MRQVKMVLKARRCYGHLGGKLGERLFERLIELEWFKPEEFAAGDTAKDYCVHCSRPDGSMQTYEEKLDSMTGFIIKTQGFDAKAARLAASELMAKLPAWRGR